MLQVVWNLATYKKYRKEYFKDDQKTTNTTLKKTCTLFTCNLNRSLLYCQTQTICIIFVIHLRCSIGIKPSSNLLGATRNIGEYYMKIGWILERWWNLSEIMHCNKLIAPIQHNAKPQPGLAVKHSKIII